jgi:hypothetical protein
MLSSLFYIGLIKVMDDRSWMYRDLLQELRMMDYCNGVQGFFNYAISNPKKLVEAILYVHTRDVKIKSFLIQML